MYDSPKSIMADIFADAAKYDSYLSEQEAAPGAGILEKITGLFSGYWNSFKKLFSLKTYRREIYKAFEAAPHNVEVWTRMARQKSAEAQKAKDPKVAAKLTKVAEKYKVKMESFIAQKEKLFKVLMSTTRDGLLSKIKLVISGMSEWAKAIINSNFNKVAKKLSKASGGIASIWGKIDFSKLDSVFDPIKNKMTSMYGTTNTMVKSFGSFAGRWKGTIGAGTIVLGSALALFYKAQGKKYPKASMGMYQKIIVSSLIVSLIGATMVASTKANTNAKMEAMDTYLESLQTVKGNALLEASEGGMIVSAMSKIFGPVVNFLGRIKNAMYAAIRGKVDNTSPYALAGSILAMTGFYAAVVAVMLMLFDSVKNLVA